MKKTPYLLFLLLAGLLFISCSKEDLNDNPKDTTSELPGEEPDGNLDLEIKDFEWKAMNVWYLFKDDKDVLQDDYFANQTELNAWLSDWDTPEDLFYNGLLYKYEDVDRFSWIVDDYEELENEFAGITETDGMKILPFNLCNGCTEVGVAVRYVIKGSPADEAGIKRGMVFREVDGQSLNVNNYLDLTYYNTSLSVTYGFIHKNDWGDNTFGPVEQEIGLTKTNVEENPIHVAKTLNIGGKNIGYLMYNNFVHDYDDELNDAFGKFKSDGVTDLILDLRYNTGGRLTSSVDLASMITGQLKGKVFLKEKYNNLITQAFIDEYGEESLITRFDDQIFEYDDDPEFPAESINSLNLNKLYVITSGSTYSASEVLINGLNPHIDVVQIGTVTGGKFQGSITLYDSDNFMKNGAHLNPDHKYAIQPLVASNTNVNNEAYPEGLIPNIEEEEHIKTFGTLGDPNEPLLKTALDLITGNTSRAMQAQNKMRKVESFRLKGAELQEVKPLSLDGTVPPLSFEK